MNEVSETEMILLRSFYLAWQHLHSIPRKPQNRRRQEDAAQELVDAANTLKNFYEAQQKPKLELVNG